jgi:hypothetical protein
MQMSKLYLLALFGLLSSELQGCGGGDEEETPTDEEPVVEEDAVTVTSTLTLEGVTVEQAELMSDAIVAGIAETLDGISVDDIELGAFARRLSGRRLAGVTVTFTVTVPEGMTPTALSDAVSEAAADPTALLSAIVEAVKADADLLAALVEAGVDIDAVTVTVSEPEIVGAAPTEAPATEAPATKAPATEAPATEKPTEAPTEAPVNGTNSSRRLEFAFTTNELIA